MTSTTQTASPAGGERSAEPPRTLTYQPHVDIRDLGTEVLFEADIPGANRDGIDVRLEDGVLSVHAAVPPRDLPGTSLRQEYGIGDYRRSFRLGDGFDASRTSAEYRHGVLTIRVPRLPEVQPRKIDVRAP